MERLKDESSTNLYIEGLPLSIDEPVCILETLCLCFRLKNTFCFH